MFSSNAHKLGSQVGENGQWNSVQDNGNRNPGQLEESGQVFLVQVSRTPFKMLSISLSEEKPNNKLYNFLISK